MNRIALVATALLLLAPTATADDTPVPPPPPQPPGCYSPFVLGGFGGAVRRWCDAPFVGPNPPPQQPQQPQQPQETP